MLVDDFRHLEQKVARGIGGNRLGEPVIDPIKGADAAIFEVKARGR